MSFSWKGLSICIVLFAFNQGRLAAEGEPPVQLNRTNLLEFVFERGEVRPVQSIADWQERRNSIHSALEEVMGPLPGLEKRAPLQPEFEEETDCGNYICRFLSYCSEPGSRVPAYLLVPKKALFDGSLRPGVLCLHQTHPLGQKVVVGLGNSPDDEYAVELVQRGYVCLAPAYPLLGNYQPDLRALGYRSGTMKAIWDNIRGLDFLESLPYVKKAGFGAIGHSLGAHNAIYTAAFDLRIKVIVSSCGFDSFNDYMAGDITGWASERYLPRLRDYPRSQIPFDFAEIIGVLAPRLCFVSAPLHDSNFQAWSVDRVVSSARAVYQLYGVPENLLVEHPDCAHFFPAEMREEGYEVIESQLR